MCLRAPADGSVLIYGRPHEAVKRRALSSPFSTQHTNVKLWSLHICILFVSLTLDFNLLLENVIYIELPSAILSIWIRTLVFQSFA